MTAHRRIEIGLAFSDHAYRLLLRSYPRAFRERFAGEMAQVFEGLCRDTYVESGARGVFSLCLSVVWDWIGAVIDQWWLILWRQKGAKDMPTNLNNPDNEIRPLTTAQAALAALPFLLFGISTLVEKLNFFQAGTPPLSQVLILHPFLAFNWLILIGLAIAILAGFPRWGFSFFGWALLFGWWWSDWKIWLSFLAVWLVALLVRRSLHPLRTMVTGLWKDWTLFSFAIYILYSWTYIGYDENHHPYLLVFVAVTALVTALGAWGYFRSWSPLRRILWLVGGLAAATVLTGINGATWDYRAYDGFPDGDNSVILVPFIFLGVLTAIMVGNGLVAVWRLARDRRLKKQGS